MEALADDLKGNAQECDITREEVINSERFCITVKKMLDYYGCNAFAAPCPDDCATRRLNEEHMTFSPLCPSPSSLPWETRLPTWATPTTTLS